MSDNDNKKKNITVSNIKQNNPDEQAAPVETDDSINATNIINLPILPLSEIVIFPYTLSTLVIDKEETIKFIVKISEGDRLIGLFPDLSSDSIDSSESIESFPDDSLQTDLQFETINIKEKSISNIGVLGRIVKLLRFPDNTVRVLVRGLKRIQFHELIQDSPHLIAKVGELPALVDNSLETVAMARNAQNQFQEIINMSPNFPEEMKVAILNVDDYSRLADLIADTLNISFTEKLGILTAPSLNERFQLLTMLLNREVEVLHLGNEIQTTG